MELKANLKGAIIAYLFLFIEKSKKRIYDIFFSFSP